MRVDPISLAGSIATDVAVKAPDPEMRTLIQAVRAVNAAGFLGQDSELRFAYERGVKHPVMRIVDRRTQEVLSQIPPEAVLRMAEALKNSGRGR